MLKPLTGEASELTSARLQGCFGVVNRQLNEETGEDVGPLHASETHEEKVLRSIMGSLEGGVKARALTAVPHMSIGNLSETPPTTPTHTTTNNNDAHK